MTITQLEYILAVNRFKNFGLAAENCFVTQPTLSMQIQKLEEELDVLIFDRSRKPIETTEMGQVVVDQAVIALKEFNKIKESIKNSKGEVSGQLSIGIIPTIAPYLVPLFIIPLMKSHNDLNIQIAEMTTVQIVKELANHTIDCGILATPLERKQIIEEPLYYEPLVVYLSPNHRLFNNKTLTVEDIESENLLMLTEEHCLQSQIRNLCSPQQCSPQQYSELSRFKYTTGSLETIKKMVELSNGITLLPELATHNFDIEQMDRLRYFRGTEPVREISVVTYSGFRKASAIEALKNSIVNNVPAKMRSKLKKNILPL